jgi:galactokinase
MEQKNIFVPGRLCLFGEHTDWAGGYKRIDKSVVSGYCIAIGTDQGIYAEVSPHPDKFIIKSYNMNDEQIGTQQYNMDESTQGGKKRRVLQLFGRCSLLHTQRSSCQWDDYK